ncbi:MAG: hypothetical protein ACJAT1_000181 [Marivirga sp.]|jgi:hypothetical protein
MKITAKTMVSDILKEYGDIAEIMEIFGIKSVGKLGFRKIATRFISVRTAAFVHRVPLDGFIRMVEKAIERKQIASIAPRASAN